MRILSQLATFALRNVSEKCHSDLKIGTPRAKIGDELILLFFLVPLVPQKSVPGIAIGTTHLYCSESVPVQIAQTFVLNGTNRLVQTVGTVTKKQKLHFCVMKWKIQGLAVHHH